MRKQPYWLRVREDKVIAQKKTAQAWIEYIHKYTVIGLNTRTYNDPDVNYWLGEYRGVRNMARRWNELWVDHPIYQIRIPDIPDELIRPWWKRGGEREDMLRQVRMDVHMALHEMGRGGNPEQAKTYLGRAEAVLAMLEEPAGGERQ